MAVRIESVKWIPGTRFMVDGFEFQQPSCKHYFLTHFHSDHTIGLGRRFTAGTLYCSPITARLLQQDMRLQTHDIQVLQLDETVVIEGVKVTAMDANHCPGSILLLFEVPRPGPAGDAASVYETILHTGDFRAADWMWRHPALQRLGGRVDTLFLDTTYALPRHTFPPQAQAMAAIAAAMQEALATEPGTVCVMAAYHIGKERAIFSAARAAGLKVYCTTAKRHVLSLLELPSEDMALLIEDPAQARLHISSWGVRPEGLHAFLRDQPPGAGWTHVLGVRPTGWTYRASGKPQVWRDGAVTLLGVPYSEHSSWDELRACVAALRPKRLVPTVGGATPPAQRAIIDRFADLMDLSCDRSRMHVYLRASIRPGAGAAGAGRAQRSLRRCNSSDAPYEVIAIDCEEEEMCSQDQHQPHEAEQERGAQGTTLGLVKEHVVQLGCSSSMPAHVAGRLQLHSRCVKEQYAQDTNPGVACDVDEGVDLAVLFGEASATRCTCSTAPGAGAADAAAGSQACSICSPGPEHGLCTAVGPTGVEQASCDNCAKCELTPSPAVERVLSALAATLPHATAPAATQVLHHCDSDPGPKQHFKGQAACAGRECSVIACMPPAKRVRSVEAPGWLIHALLPLPAAAAAVGGLQHNSTPHHECSRVGAAQGSLAQSEAVAADAACTIDLTDSDEPWEVAGDRLGSMRHGHTSAASQPLRQISIMTFMAK